MQRTILRLSLILTLLFCAGSASLMAASLMAQDTLSQQVIPQKQAAHFCQLLMYDGNEVCQLSIHAKRLAIEKNDTLTAEQMLTTFLFRDDNWSVLRLFPHKADDGSVSWYAPADKLPSTIDAEHQKYIREVLPRLQQQIVAGNWETVDAYIDRMIEYQCQFGGSKLAATPSPYTILGAAGCLAILIFAALIMGRSKKSA